MRYQRMHDVILFYTQGNEHTFNIDFEPVSNSTKKRFKGKKVLQDPKTNSRKLVLEEDAKGLPQRDVFDIGIIAGFAKERTGYPTQKPLKLLQRIIKASSNEGDMVLDPFCGCATACIAAEAEHRHWVGIDVSPKAAELVKHRMKKELGLFYDGVHRTDIPKRTDIGDLPFYNSKENKNYLYGEQGGHCNGCGEHFEKRNLEVDHIIARAKGGTDHRENLQLLCGHCNRVKGDRGQEYLIAKLAA